MSPSSPQEPDWKSTASGWALIAPSLAVVFIFTIYPIARSVFDSFVGDGDVSLQQYETLFNDDVFWKVFRNNIVFALITVPVSIVISLAMALWVNGKLRGRGFMRLAFFTPTILPMVAAASIWLFFYTPGYGPIDVALSWFGVPEHNWLGNPSTALPAIMTVTVWKETGLFMVFYLAGLQNMPTELEEASMLEGASAWHHFRRVTFPLLMPTTLFVTVVAMANAFKHVEHIFVMTKGGPDNASNLLLYYIYRVAFEFYDERYAATLTVLLMLSLLFLAFLQFRFIEKRTHYQ